MKRLYIVEGLPSSGKSTTAKKLAEMISGNFVDEGTGNHPADYEFSAFLTKDEYEAMPENYKKASKAVTKECAGGFVIDMGDLWSVAGITEYLLPHKIYDFLPWDVEKPVMLDRWKTYAEEYRKSWKTDVFNCVFLQNPMCETMLRFNFPEEVSRAFVEEILGCLSGIEVCVVYLKTNDIQASLERVLEERGEEWLEGVIEYHCEGEYGLSSGLEGFDGYVSALQAREERELRILESLPVKKLVLTDASKDWEEAYRKIREWI